MRGLVERTRTSGFSLVEVVVALVLFSVLGAGAVQLFYQAATASTLARGRATLLWEAEALADSLRERPPGSGTGSGGERRVPGAGTLRWSGGGGPVILFPEAVTEPWLELPVPLGAPPAGAVSW